MAALQPPALHNKPTRPCSGRLGYVFRQPQGPPCGRRPTHSAALPRRLAAAGLGLAAARRLLRAGAEGEELSRRLSAEQLIIPSPSEAKSVTYPSWLFGEWEVCARPVAFSEPLGERFLDESTKEAIREEFKQKQSELRWRSRFYWESLDTGPEPEPFEIPGGFLLAAYAAECKGPVVQFRAFNAGQEVKAFLKQRIPRVIAVSDPHEQPLQISVYYPIEQEEEEFIRTVSLRLETCQLQRLSASSFVSSELFRQVISTEGEIDSVGDFEVINSYTLLEPGHVTVKNRVAKYLVPTDSLFEESAGRAVSCLDYSWDLRRLQTCIETPYGEQCAGQESAC
ncbi:unnamed protein product [Effrenium voratum]|nr:unnamed protein product [Effrenium voratum]CAJ1415601.1 unnamed protein product [Effrenium voratum]